MSEGTSEQYRKLAAMARRAADALTTRDDREELLALADHYEERAEAGRTHLVKVKLS